MQTPQFNENKATQVAAAFIRLKNGRMNYTRLLKLMYLADRTSLIQTGRPITFDSFAALPFGPVLETVKKRIDTQKAGTREGLWGEHIGLDPDNRYFVVLEKECEQDELTKSDLGFISDVFEHYGEMELFEELIDNVMHNLPEWSDPGNSSFPIEYDDILTLDRDKTNSPDDIQSIKEELEGVALMDELLSSFAN